MPQISFEDASAELKALVQQACAGEDVVITQNDQPVAKLVPITSAPLRAKRQAGRWRGKIRMSEDFDEPLADFAERSGVKWNGNEVIR